MKKKKIVVIGPESTGKSTLCQLLSEHFDCPWVPEYAREYLLQNGMKYNYDDLLEIAKGQLRTEDAVNAGSDKPLLIIDTDMHVMKVWCEFVFGKVHSYILEQIKERRYDLFLLCNIDLPWIKDELREYPEIETRRTLYNIYKEMLAREELPFVEVSGNYSERLAKAVDAINSLYNPAP